jgi:hypothetical protein
MVSVDERWINIHTIPNAYVPALDRGTSRANSRGTVNENARIAPTTCAQCIGNLNRLLNMGFSRKSKMRIVYDGSENGGRRIRVLF